MEHESDTLILIANGPYITMAKVSDDTLSIEATIHAFQKPVMKVHFDEARQRVIAGGLDCQVKFFEIIKEDEEL
jgi:hypothetical protein